MKSIVRQKRPLKILLSSFCVSHLLLGIGPALECGVCGGGVEIHGVQSQF